MNVVSHNTHACSYVNRCVLSTCLNYITSVFRGKMCGICGDMNDNDKDDIKNGSSAATCRRWRNHCDDEDRYTVIRLDDHRLSFYPEREYHDAVTPESL